MHQSTGTYFTYRAENRVFQDVGLWDNTQVTVTGLAEPERVDALLVEAVDLATYEAMALVVVAVAALASYLPARRAATVDPMVVLRQD